MEVKGFWMETVTGKLIDSANLSPNDIDIVDIAYSLSGLNRFGAHALPQEPVAKHSIHAYLKADADIKLEALLHDAHEAYLQDITKGFKETLPMYKEAARLFDEVISLRFLTRIDIETEKRIKEIDTKMLSTEARQLMQNWRLWPNDISSIQPYNINIKAVNQPQFLFSMFLDCYMQSRRDNHDIIVPNRMVEHGYRKPMGLLDKETKEANHGITYQQFLDGGVSDEEA